MDRQCLVCNRRFQWPGRGRPSETCSQECHRLRKNTQRGEARQRARQRGIPAELHGTSTGATDYGCHCPECRKWWREYQAARRAALKEAVNG